MLLIPWGMYGMGYITTLKNLYKASGLSASLIIEVFIRRKSILVIVEKVDVGEPGLKIISDKGSFLLRKHHFDCYSNNFGRSTSIQAGMLSYGIPVPLYLR